jgi:acetyl-CoA synthetase
MTNSKNHIKSVLSENRLFRPSADYRKKSLIQTESEREGLVHAFLNDPKRFWKKWARELLIWQKDFKKVLHGKHPHVTWFEDGKLNVSENCIDRHLLTFRRHKAAIIWEGENGDREILTYSELHRRVCKLANYLEQIGIKPGDRVTIYMPMVPEAIVAMQACARIGAIHTVVFGGFSAEALSDRNNDAGSKLLITADGSFRKGSMINIKETVDQALPHSQTIKNVLVFKRTGQPVTMKLGRDHWWHDTVDKASDQHEPKAFSSEQTLFILYTSGSTGKPKGVYHSSAGYLLGATLSSKYIFDLSDQDVFWCTADIGWITGHSYVAYGPLSLGSTILIYEGAFNVPDCGRPWQMIERHKVSVLYTSPTAIRTFVKAGDEWPKKSDLSSLRLLGTVGEPINPEAWMWYFNIIGRGLCPIVDTWWQTETGSIAISATPGSTVLTPGSATKPFFGIDAAIVDQSGKEVKKGDGGYLVIRKPWPSALRGVWRDEKRYVSQYWSQYQKLGYYFTGDGARQDKRGNFWILGRIDDVINVSGHRLSTMEIESSLVSHPKVAEAASVGKPDELKGEVIVCFVTLKSGFDPSPELNDELRKHVVKSIGALARPEEIRFAESLPKTRSGKIMRRLLKDIARGQDVTQDTSTLEDYSVLAKLSSES